MKRFKIGFLAIIALLAIGLTITAQAGIFKKSVVAPPPGTCTTADATTFTTTSATFQRGVDNCNTVPNNVCVESFISPAQSFQCQGGNKFCCALLANDANCTTTGKKVVQVMCQP